MPANSNTPAIRNLPGRRYHIDFEDFDQKAADTKVKLFILCSPHNPVGRVWRLEELLRLAEILQRELPKVKLVEPEGTYLIWLDFTAYGLTDEQLDDIIIHKANLWLDSGHIFGQGGSGFQRINIACPWQALEKGLERLAAAFKNIQ